jgi:hypothetical protein
MDFERNSCRCFIISGGFYMKKIAALLLGIILILSFIIFKNYTSSPYNGISSITFDNTSDGEDKISMTERRTYTVSFEYKDDIDVDKLTWFLQRDEGEFDPDLFPNQYLGGRLEDWKVAFGENLGKTIFRITGTKLKDNKVTMTFCSDNTFFSTDSIYSWDGVRNYMMDYIGDFELICKDGEKEIASATIRVNPYDSYRTKDELAVQLKEAAESIDAKEGIYAQVFSMGSSSMGEDIPYMILADSRSSVESYQNLTEKALEDPQTVMDAIQSGDQDYRIPIMFSNVHPDEIDGPDAIMEFIETFEESGTASYNTLTGFTEAGKKEFKAEMDVKGIKWSSLISPYVTGLGAITLDNLSPEGYDISALHTDYASGTIDLDKYYTIEKREYNIQDILDKVFFILIPTENPDGREMNTRCNGNGFDLNRDALYQTQPETEAMSRLIAQWNPAAFVELHGYNNSFQVEPCTPPHSSNVEVDLMMEYGLKLGEAFGNAAVASNSLYNSYALCMRDYLVYDYAEEDYSWDMYCWDEQTSNYTPQYSQLHGTIAFTVELPYSGDEGVKTLKYGMLGYSKCVAENSKDIYMNQLKCWLRGVNNQDEESVRGYYVDKYDNKGAEGDILRPRSEENHNYFPEYYVIPLDSSSQRNLSEAAAMQQYLMDNGIKVSILKEDTSINGITYRSGSLVIDMHQAKRNAANAMLSQGSLMTGWYGLYGSSIGNLPDCRGFSCYAVHIQEAFEGRLQELEKPVNVKGVFTGDEGYGVVIENDSLDAVRAVNFLLDTSCQVGFVTKGTHRGSFIISYKDYENTRDKYIIKAIGVRSVEEARLIKKPLVYVAGNMDEAKQGLSDYENLMNTERSCDIYALQKQMGFTLTKDLDKATVIAGSQVLSLSELEKVQSRIPYIAYGSSAIGIGDEDDAGYEKNSVMALLKGYGLKGVNNWIYDALFRVKYSGDSLITAVYEAEGDNLMYGYGGNYFTSIPSGASAIIYNTSETPIEGFFPREALKGFMGKGKNVQAFTFAAEQYRLTAFANSLTSKVHQTDDYRYLSNSIYQYSLSEECFVINGK